MEKMNIHLGSRWIFISIILIEISLAQLKRSIEKKTSFLTISEATSLMWISPIYSNSHSSVQTVDRNKRTMAFDSYHRPTHNPHLESASHLTVFSQLVRLPHSCVYHPYIQTAIAQSRRSIETNGQRRSTAITEPHKHHISNLRHTSQFSHSVAISLMCISPIYSNSHSSVQTVDRNKRTTAFDSYHRASRAPHLESASHLTVFLQLVRLSHSCVYHPYIQTAIAQSRRSIETNGQRRSTAITDPHTTHISNLRHTSQFSHN